MKELLIVENSVEYREFVKTSINRDKSAPWAIKCTCPEAWDETVAALHGTRYDCIVVDFNLWGDKSAVNVIREARESQPLTSIVVVTGISQEELANLEGVNIRGIICIEKSAPKSKLLEAIYMSITETGRRVSEMKLKEEIYGKLDNQDRKLDKLLKMKSWKRHLTWRKIAAFWGVVTFLSPIIWWLIVNIAAPAVDKFIVTQQEFDKQNTAIVKKLDEMVSDIKKLK